MNMQKKCITAAVCALAMAFALPASAQMAAGKSKFVGNVIASYVPSDYSTYWNQVTPENGTKWGSVEFSRGNMNWKDADVAYNYAQSRGYKFKFHTLVWGNQEPTWVKSLSAADQRAEVEQWIQAACKRYPNSWAIDVVNEPLHAQPSYKAALGGDGATGWDWIVTSYQLARKYCPNSKLFINEYATEGDANARARFKGIIKILKDRKLIDGIGLQAHYFTLDRMNASQMKAALDDYATLGVDVYISELDLINGGTDAGQKAKYQELFPVMWQHAAVKGITLWGYKVGQTWESGSGLVNSNGSERPALTWLKSYLKSAAKTN